MKQEARKSSVENLQRLYTVVVGLAITESLHQLFSELGNSMQLPEFTSFLTVCCLLLTIIPFYHGANRYLDSTYVTGERSGRSGALMIDFTAFFIEGLLFFILSLLIKNSLYFFSLLAILFVFDAVWVWITRITSSPLTIDTGPEYKAWAIVNIIAAVFLFISFWSNLLNWDFWPTLTIRVIAAFLISVFRTVIDYVTVWKFYYPDKSTYFMPVPRPAIPIHEGNNSYSIIKKKSRQEAS